MLLRCRLVLVCVVMLLGGCGPHPVHHVQSELLPDGSVTRAILQPKHAVFDADQWDRVRKPDGTKSYDQYEGDITVAEIPGDVPTDKNSAKVSKVLAITKVKAGQEIPPHVEFRAEGIDEPSTLKLERSVRDYGFVSDCSWTETLTEVVDLADAVRARREFATLFADQCERAFKRWFDPEFDSTELVWWLRTDGDVLAEGLFQIVVFRHRTGSEERQDELARAALWKVFANQCRRYDVDVPKIDPQSNYFVNTPLEVTEAFEKLVARVVAKHLKRRDGQPVDEAAIRKIFFSEDKLATEKRDAQWQEAVAEYPGGTDAYQAAERKLAARIFGIHGHFILGGRDRFRCTVMMPGVIVESNGTQLSERFVQWRFHTGDAFPQGYTMSARSIAIWDAQLPGMQPERAQDRRHWFKLIELASRHQKLAEAMRECRAVRSLYPLEKLRREPESDLQRDAKDVLRILSSGNKDSATR